MALIQYHRTQTQRGILDGPIVFLTPLRESPGAKHQPSGIRCIRFTHTDCKQRFQQVVLHQGRIERFFLDSLKTHSSIEVERGCLPDSVTLDETQVEDTSAYPITVTLRHLAEDEATPPQGNSHSIGEDAPKDGLFRSNLAADDTDDLLRKSRHSGDFTETLHAKYMIGCDGAHSWTRRQLGFNMEGEQTDFI